MKLMKPNQTNCGFNSINSLNLIQDIESNFWIWIEINRNLSFDLLASFHFMNIITVLSYIRNENIENIEMTECMMAGK